jgi:hypothetical protein
VREQSQRQERDERQEGDERERPPQPTGHVIADARASWRPTGRRRRSGWRCR